MAVRATQTDLELALGGAAYLVQLQDKDGDGIADAASVTSILAWAAGEIDGRIRRQVPPESLTAPYPANLVMHEAAVGAYLAFRTGTGGLAMPDNIERGYRDALAWADAVGDKRITFSGTAEAPHQIRDTLVDINPSGTRINRRTMRGFC